MNAANSKPKVMLLGDRPLWAFHYIQEFIRKHLSDSYDFYIDFSACHPISTRMSLRYRFGHWRRRHSIKNIDNYRRLLQQGETYDIAVMLNYQFSIERKLPMQALRLIKGIYVDHFPPDSVNMIDKDITIEQFAKRYLSEADAVVCGSTSIVERYKMCHPNVHCANLCYDSWFNRLTPKMKNVTKRFIVGWTGNPEKVFKGYYDIVVPAVHKAATLRPGIELKTRFKGPLERLPRFYDDVDVVLIASSGDAGPSMFQEACLCDVPAISTHIGWPGEIIKHNINGLIVKRDVKAMCDAIIRLYDERDLLFSYAQKIRDDYCQIYGIEPMTQAWRNLFQSVLT